MDNLGSKLKELREAKQISLEEIHRKTSINYKMLRAIESNNFPEIPAVYLRSYIQKYAKEVGLDSSEFLKDFVSPKIETKKTPSLLEQKELFSSNSMLTILLLIVGIFVLGFLLKFIFDYKEPPKTKQAEEVETINQTDENIETMLSEKVKGDSLVLKLVISDTSRVKIISDCTDVFEKDLLPNTSKKFFAKNNFDLEIENASSMKIIFNADTLKINGVNKKKIFIDKNGVKIEEIK
ncbi:helix-turn-helix domain-containing protein [bacterium]|nr:helix-turn-helix domain-containing protein [bacterium]